MHGALPLEMPEVLKLSIIIFMFIMTKISLLKLQRKDYTALTKFLPPKYEYVLEVRMTPIQCKLYQYYLDHLTGTCLQLAQVTRLMVIYYGAFAVIGRVVRYLKSAL